MRNPGFLLSFICLILFMFSQCDKDEFGKRPFTRILTLEVAHITDSGVTFNAEIVDRDDQEILEYGFIYSKDSTLSLNIGNKINFKIIHSKNSFHSKVEQALIKDQKYYVRGYIISKSYVVLGNIVSFYSNGSKFPIIRSFFPQEVLCGDTIKILGSYFSPSKTENNVKLNDFRLEVISSSDSSIEVLAESNEEIATLSLTVEGRSVNAENKVKTIIPKISHFYPPILGIGDTFTLVGQNLGKIKNFKLELNEFISRPIQLFKDSIKFRIDNFQTLSFNGSSIFKSNCINFELSQKIIYQPPVIDSVSPQIITNPDQRITISGKYLLPGLKDFRIITPDGIESLNGDFSPTSIKFILPNSIINGISKHYDFDIEIYVTDYYLKHNKKIRLEYNSYWTIKKPFPGEARTGAIAFSINGLGYFGLGRNNEDDYLNDMWKYDPQNDHWTQIESFPGRPRADASFIINQDKILVGLGYQGELIQVAGQNKYVYNYFTDFYAFDINSLSWNKIENFPGEPRSNACGFSLNNLGYIIGGFSIDTSDYSYKFYKSSYVYDLKSDIWMETVQLPNILYYPNSVQFEKSAYIFDIYDFYQFDGVNWLKLNSIGSLGYDKAYFLNGNNVYFEWRGALDLFSFDLLTRQLKFLEINRSYIHTRNCFSINGIGYAITLPIDGVCSVWQFDPSKTR